MWKTVDSNLIAVEKKKKKNCFIHQYPHCDYEARHRIVFGGLRLIVLPDIMLQLRGFEPAHLSISFLRLDAPTYSATTHNIKLIIVENQNIT